MVAKRLLECCSQNSNWNSAVRVLRRGHFEKAGIALEMLVRRLYLVECLGASDVTVLGCVVRHATGRVEMTQNASWRRSHPV